eukprot:m.70523 g.70523  ORF g.70523 m.70523 type:complete len:200 (+) comp14071_c1_seq1:232-831(+)
MSKRQALIDRCLNPVDDMFGDDDLVEIVEEALVESDSDPHLVRALEEAGWDREAREFASEPDLQLLHDRLTSVKAAAPRFVGIKFCQECNNMLFPQEDKARKILLYTCRNCDHTEEANDNCVYVNRVTRDVDSLTHVNKDVASDPTLPHSRGNMEIECPKCNYDDAVFFQAQSNREQSKMHLFFVCCSCGFKWTEASGK